MAATRTSRLERIVSRERRVGLARPARRIAPTFIVLALAFGLVGVAAASLGRDDAQRLRAQAPVLGLADLHSPGAAPSEEPGEDARLLRPAGLLAQGGIAGSTIDLLDRSGDANVVGIDLVDTTSFERSTIDTELEADGGGRIHLADEPAAERGVYSGALEGSGAFAASARTTWSNQSSAAFLAEEAANDLVLPMLIVDQDGHSTVFAVFNPSEDQTASVNLLIFDPADGALLNTFAAQIDPGGVSRWNTYIDGHIFGPGILPPNAGDGFVGSLFVDSNIPVVGLAYGEQIEMPGSAALGLRPRAAGATSQILPWLRKDASGDTLIAISAATQGNDQTDVSATFLPEEGSAGGDPIEVSFTLGPRGSAYLDPSGQGRGTVEMPNLPDSFRGSVVVEASRPVLAAALERLHDAERDMVYAASAYNGFAPEELSAGYEAPTLRRQTDYRSSLLQLQNPADAEAAVTVEIRDDEDQVVDTSEHRLAPGAGLRLDLAGLEALPRGYGSASIRADRPIAALVGEERDTSVSYPLPPVSFNMGSVNMSQVRGTATMTQIGEDVEVVLELDTETPISPAIVGAPCSDENGRRVHTLRDTANGRSTTVLRGVSLLELSESGYAIRGFRGTRARTCGDIPPIYDADDADASWVRALPARYEPPPATEAPTPTSTPDAPATEVPTETPDTPETPGPTATDEPGDGPTIYMPIARKDAG